MGNSLTSVGVPGLAGGLAKVGKRKRGGLKSCPYTNTKAQQKSTTQKRERERCRPSRQDSRDARYAKGTVPSSKGAEAPKLHKAKVRDA